LPASQAITNSLQSPGALDCTLAQNNEQRQWACGPRCSLWYLDDILDIRYDGYMGSIVR
jgi:hypothetical protein